MSDSPTPDVSLRERAERAIQTDRDAKDKPLSFVAGDKAKDALAALYLAAPPSVILALLSRVERAEADSKRLDWITEGNHSVMCYGVGRWMLDVPADSPRAAIDLAMSDDALASSPTGGTTE